MPYCARRAYIFIISENRSRLQPFREQKTTFDFIVVIIIIFLSRPHDIGIIIMHTTHRLQLYPPCSIYYLLHPT